MCCLAKSLATWTFGPLAPWAFEPSRNACSAMKCTLLRAAIGSGARGSGDSGAFKAAVPPSGGL
eukprot:4307239-Alexandrium_andersonii.AAC.1